MELLDRARTAAMIGSDHYLGAWIDRRGAKINPLAYVRGLARAAAKAGARLHENSRATALGREGSGWRISTARGSVLADRVFLCTNAYTDELGPACTAASSRSAPISSPASR